MRLSLLLVSRPHGFGRRGQEPALSLLAAHRPLCPQCYRDLALVSRDGMNIVLNKINQILMEKYLKLQDTCRTQVRPQREAGSSSETSGGRGEREEGRAAQPCLGSPPPRLTGPSPHLPLPVSHSWCGWCGNW